MANTTNFLSPISIYHEFMVLGCANTSGNSFVLAPSADLNDNIGQSNNRFTNVFSYGLSLGNTTINSYGNTTANSASANGYTVLPGGVIMQWGSGVANTTGNTVTYSVPFAVNVFSFHVTGSQANVTIATANTTKIVVTASAGAPIFTWLALGM
jgi:hypothetical protein